MEIKVYREEIKRTCPSLGSQAVDAAHMVLGFISENVELEDAFVKEDMVNVAEEVADKLWYTFNLANIYDIDFPNLTKFNDDFIETLDGEDEENYDILAYEALVANLVKRHLAYQRQPDRIELTRLLFNILVVINNTCISNDVDIHAAMQKNIDKLRARFPEKFTTENALVRDLETERKILEA